MRPVVLSRHALDRITERGTNEQEVRAAVQSGSRKAAREGRIWCRLNFEFKSTWQGKYYAVKQVAPVIIEQADRILVVTVCTFFF